MLTRDLFPNSPSLDGDPQYDKITIRNIPHNRDYIKEIERSIGGTVVTDDNPLVLRNLDAIFKKYTAEHNGKIPGIIEDAQTHQRFKVVKCTIPASPLNLTTYIYV